MRDRAGRLPSIGRLAATAETSRNAIARKFPCRRTPTDREHEAVRRTVKRVCQQRARIANNATEVEAGSDAS